MSCDQCSCSRCSPEYEWTYIVVREFGGERRYVTTLDCPSIARPEPMWGDTKDRRRAFRWRSASGASGYAEWKNSHTICHGNIKPWRVVRLVKKARRGTAND